MIVALLVLIACILLFGASRVIGAVSSVFIGIGLLVAVAAGVTAITRYVSFDFQNFQLIYLVPIAIFLALIVTFVFVNFTKPPKRK